MKKPKDDYDNCIETIERMIRRKGKSNVFFMSEIYELIQDIRTLQEEKDATNTDASTNNDE